MSQSLCFWSMFIYYNQKQHLGVHASTTGNSEERIDEEEKQQLIVTSR